MRKKEICYKSLKTFRQIIQYDELLGHKYVANQKARLRYGNDGYFIETDQRGFRNSVQLPGKEKIIILGDSFTAGDGVENSKRFSDRINALFNCEVVNLGVSGFGVDQQILAYESLKDQIEHSIVILAPHLDDLYRNMMQERQGIDKSTGKATLIPKPYFQTKADGIELKNSPVPRKRENVSESNQNGFNPGFTDRAKNFVERRLLKKQLHPELAKDNSKEWTLMHQLIQRLKLATGDKQLFIVPFPYYDSVTYNESPLFLKSFGKHEDEKTKVINAVDSIYEAYNGDKDGIFLPLCGHFTEKTHTIIAKVIGESIGLQTRNEVPRTNSIEKNYVLGISCFYHDSGAALLEDGKIIAAVQEERFTRIKHDKAFPSNGINYCLEAAGISINDLRAIVYYDKESWTIERVLHNSVAIGEKGDDFWSVAQRSLYTKLKLPSIIRNRTNYKGDIYKTEHHVSHAAGAFYPSPFNEAAILVVDGVGEWACSTIASGEGTSLKLHKQQQYPHSLGLLYSAFTYFCGFKVNSGEYKLMGLAPYGKPIYSDIIKDKLITINDDGSIFLHLEYFSFLEGVKMTNDNFAELFEGPERQRESDITRREMDLAASIQEVTEEIVIKMANHAYEITGKKNLVMSGGVALNCVSNGKLYDETPFEDFYFQPASGDAGGALGCALNWHFENVSEAQKSHESNAYLGPEFSDDETFAFLNTKGVPFNQFEESNRADQIAEMLANKKIIGHLDGRMEFGPRALGNRSIIADATDVDMQSTLNLKIKFRESFRPFAPIYAEERTKDYFDFDRPSPYMLVVRNVKEELLTKPADKVDSDNMIEIVNQKRSELPAITHVDNSARLQSVNANQNKRFHDVLMAFERKTGKAVLINTSFNVRGEPIVCNLEDAYRCFMRTNMDVLVLNNYYLLKEDQPDWQEVENWQETFELD